MPRRGRPWTERDDQELRKLLAGRQRTADVATALGRTVDAVRGRAQQLGLRLNSSQRPWRRPPRDLT